MFISDKIHLFIQYDASGKVGLMEMFSEPVENWDWDVPDVQQTLTACPLWRR